MTRALARAHDEIDETESYCPSSPATDRIDNGLRVLMRQVAVVRPGEDNSGPALSGVTSKDIKSSCEELQRLYEPAVLDQARALAECYRCPMHPDVIGMKGAICPKCGMPLNSQVQFSMSVLPPGAELARIIRAQVDTDAPLQVGMKTSAHLILYRPQGEPVTPDQLCEVHTQRIHLLIVDGSFTDYHHEHPQPTNVAGRYDFAFTPQKPGTYRVWADLQPYLTGIQQYVMTVIPAATSEELLSNTADKLEAIQLC